MLDDEEGIAKIEEAVKSVKNAKRKPSSSSRT
jgi:hypothetical protein